MQTMTRQIEVEAESRTVEIGYIPEMGRIAVGTGAVVIAGLSVRPLNGSEVALVRRIRRNPDNYVSCGAVIMPRGVASAVVALRDEIVAQTAREDEIVATHYPRLADLRAAADRMADACAAYGRAREHGYPPSEAQAMRNAEDAYATLRTQCPAEAAYLAAEGYARAANPSKCAAGRAALNQLRAGAEYRGVIAAMESNWSTAATEAALNA